MKFNRRITESKFIKDYDINSKETITSGHLKGTTKYTFETDRMNEVYFDNLGFLVEMNGKAETQSMTQMIAHENARLAQLNGGE